MKTVIILCVKVLLLVSQSLAEENITTDVNQSNLVVSTERTGNSSNPNVPKYNSRKGEEKKGQGGVRDIIKADNTLVFQSFAQNTPDQKTFFKQEDLPFVENPNSKNNQEILYKQIERGLPGKTHLVTEYIASVVKPDDINTGYKIDESSRVYTNRLAKAAGVHQSSKNPGMESYDAGHILGKHFGGTVDKYNLFPKNKQFQKNFLHEFEKKLAERIQKQSLTAVVEFQLKYGPLSTIPTEVEFSFRLYDGKNMNTPVETIIGKYPNKIDGKKRSYDFQEINISNTVRHLVITETTHLTPSRKTPKLC